jgi:hypothetical protein
MVGVNANNAIGRGSIVSTATSACPVATTPTAVTNAATNITQTSFQLNGSVNPNGLATSAYFEYGTSPTLAGSGTTNAVSVGAGNSAITLTGTPPTLACGTTFYFRMVGVNANNAIGRGSIVSTATSACPVATITSVSPNPVTGSNSPQAFTINGTNFVSGANITLRDITGGLIFANRVSSSFTSTRIVINPNFGTAIHSWTVEVINPSGQSTGQFPFSVH